MSGSTFDELTPEQVAVLEQPDLMPVVSVYDSCSRLAVHYKQQNLRIRGGIVVRNGQAKANPIDFLCDLQLKAKRCLDIRGYAMWTVFGREYDTAMQLPRKYQDLLSQEWLGTFYAYADLFKQAQRAWDAQQQSEARKADRQAASAVLILAQTTADPEVDSLTTIS